MGWIWLWTKIQTPDFSGWCRETWIRSYMQGTYTSSQVEATRMVRPDSDIVLGHAPIVFGVIFALQSMCRGLVSSMFLLIPGLKARDVNWRPLYDCA